MKLEDYKVDYSRADGDLHSTDNNQGNCKRAAERNPRLMSIAKEFCDDTSERDILIIFVVNIPVSGIFSK